MSGTRRGLMLLAVLVAMMAGWMNTAAAQVTTTTVQDTVYSANGTPASGTVLVSWNAFTTAGGQSVPAGTTSVTIGAGGVLTVALAPNAGSTPMGSYYTAVFHLSDGTTSREYWVIPVTVPGGGPATLAAIKNQVLPTSVAMQTVSKAYVDDAIAAASTGFPLDSSPYVLTAGDAMSGPLVLPADPVNTNQAADKHYVDTSVAAVSAGVGQKVSLLPIGSQVVAQPSGTSFGINGPYASTIFSGTGTSTQTTISPATAAANPSATSYTMLQNSSNCYQPGFDLGNNGTSAGGWSVCDLESNIFESGVRGIMQRSATNFSHFGQGDTADEYSYLTTFGGKVATSDEGVSHTTKQVHQVGSFSGPINYGATTGSNLIGVSAMNCGGYCLTLETKQFPDGGIMLDTSKSTGVATIGAYGTEMGGRYYTLASGSTSVSTAWGNIIGSSCTNNGNGQGQTYTSTTCNVTLGISPASPGNFVSGQDIFLEGPFEEEAAVTAVGVPSGGVQSITFSTRYAWNGGWNSLVMQGGPGGQSFTQTGAWPVAYWVVGATSPTQVFFANCVIGDCDGGNSVANIIQPTVAVNSSGLTRTNNVVSETGINDIHTFAVGSTIVVSGFTPSDLNGTFTVASNSMDSNNPLITWNQTGANETSTASGTIAPPAPSITFYPSAFITGTNGGVSGDANLATNTVPWANGDTALGAPTSEYSADTLRLVQGQTTALDGSQPSEIISIGDDGPVNAAYVLYATNSTSNAPSWAFMGAQGSYSDYFSFSDRPANNGAFIWTQGNEPISSNRKPYNIFEDQNGGAQFGYDPLNYDFTFNQSVKVPAGSFAVTQLTSDSTTINGVSCTLGSACTISTGGGSGGGTGSVTSVAVGTWPSWLTPTVTNATTTPTVTVTASSIPNTALANSSTTVNGQTCSLGSTCTVPVTFAQATGTASASQLPAATASTQGAVLLPTGATTNTLGSAAMLPGSIAVNGNVCALGGTCTIASTPAADIKYYPAAVCDSGIAYASGMTRYDNQQPQTGCVLPASSSLAYLAFNAAPTMPQYAEATVPTPPYWTGTNLYINFYSTATTGNVTWEVQTACVTTNSVVGTPTFGTPVSVTTTVSSTSGGDVVTATLSNIAAPGVNGCPSTQTTPGLLTYRIYRSATDTAAGNANLLGTTLVTGRSQ